MLWVTNTALSQCVNTHLFKCYCIHVSVSTHVAVVIVIHDFCYNVSISVWWHPLTLYPRATLSCLISDNCSESFISIGHNNAKHTEKWETPFKASLLNIHVCTHEKQKRQLTTCDESVFKCLDISLHFERLICSCV